MSVGMALKEPDVVQRVHRFLGREGLGGERLSRLFTDPHPTLTGIRALQPFQRFAIGEDGLGLHPDLLGQQSDSESLVAVEAKGPRDLLRGIAQAEVYQKGVQLSFLAAPAGALTDALVLHARDKGVGVIAVDDGVRLLHVPEARRPLNRIYNALCADLGHAAWMSDAGTFTYNLPTHYLVWVPALRGRGRVGVDDCRQLVAGYPLPGDCMAALRGARKLGLVRIGGDGVSLTDAGSAAAELLPPRTDEWTALHQALARARGKLTLAASCPAAAAVLRLLLLRDPVVQHVVEGLRTLGEAGGPFVALAQACWRLDRRKAVIFFLNPEAVPAWVSRDGQVDWYAVDPGAFRSSTFFQYKSVLRHAGVIAPHALGGASTRGYDPARDVWALDDRMRG